MIRADGSDRVLLSVGRVVRRCVSRLRGRPAALRCRLTMYGEVSRDGALRFRRHAVIRMYVGRPDGRYFRYGFGWLRLLHVRCERCGERSISWLARMKARISGRHRNCPLCLARCIVDARRGQLLLYPIVFAFAAAAYWHCRSGETLLPIMWPLAALVLGEGIVTILAPQRETRST